jgi:hypothetical protein
MRDEQVDQVITAAVDVVSRFRKPAFAPRTASV